MTSQPSLASIVAATDHTARATGDLAGVAARDRAVLGGGAHDVRAVRERPARADRPRLPPPDPGRPALQPAPAGGRRSASGDRFEEVELAYEKANALLGNIIKVTPTSKVVGDLALFVVSAGIDWDELASNPERFDLPVSVIELLRGDLGEPAGGFPQPFTERALRGAGARADETAHELDPEMRERLEEPGDRPPRGARRAAVPRPDAGAQATRTRATATCPHIPTRAVPLRPARRRRRLHRARPRRAAHLRARGDRRARRPRHAHGARARERPAAPDRRPRRVRRGADREGRARRSERRLRTSPRRSPAS